MNRRTFVVAALAWVFVVTLGSGLVWAVISNAGQKVISTDGPTAGGDASPALGRATQAAGGPSDHPTHEQTDGDDDHGKHGSDDGPDDHPSSGGQPTSGSTADHQGSPGGSTGGTGGTKSSGPSPDHGPTPVPKTWGGDAGLVKVECTGSTIELVSVVPSNGYRYEVGSDGPEQVEVEFENTSTERQTKVESSCSQGTPVFRVETESESGDD